MGNLRLPNDVVYINNEICTTETSAQFWNIEDPAAESEFLDDVGLRAKLATLVGRHQISLLPSFPFSSLILWTTGFVLDKWQGREICAYVRTEPLFNNVYSLKDLLSLDSMLRGDPSAKYRPIQIDRNSLQYLINVVGFDEEITMGFFSSRLPSFSFYLQYNDKTNEPEFMS